MANNINDITKDHPDKVIELCRQWQIDATPERRWIIGHGLRGLVKAGHPDVFPLLGYTEKPKIKITQFGLAETEISMGQGISISLSLISNSSEPQKMIIDYKVYHVKANGSSTSKVFKWKMLSLESRQSILLQKAHLFKHINTRKYYAGKHTIELVINGVSYGKIEFMLLV